MSEVAGYTGNNFPYYEILGDLTARIQTVGMEPVEAYGAYLQERESRGLGPSVAYIDYASTSITTGGHAHHMENIADVIQANTRTARLLAEHLVNADVLEANRLVVPADLGKIKEWKQSDYLTFWGLVIAGPELGKEAKQLEDGIIRSLGEFGVDLALMNDARVERKERRPEYGRFVLGMADALKSSEDSGLRLSRAMKVVSLVDSNISLGCWAEGALAEQLYIPRKGVHAVKGAEVSEAASPPLAQDIEVIMANGGHVLVARRGATLALGRADELSPTLDEVPQLH